jgi:hypothetical protein
MFGRIKAESNLEEIGLKLERAMEDINIIVRYPEKIKKVEYETSEDETKGVFDRTKEPAFIRLIIYYDDSDGTIKADKRAILENAEKELLSELERLKKEKTRYD